MPPDLATRASLCHALVADRLEHPDVPDTPGGSPSAVDLDEGRLRQIAGFVAKVRHNPVRHHLPLTMRALAATDLENDFFTWYAPDFGRARAAGMSDGERVERFVAALVTWLDVRRDDHRLVAAVLDHERVMRELDGAPATPPVAPVAPDAATASTSGCPRLRADLRLLQVDVHPGEVATAMRTGGDIARLDRSPRWFLYLPTPDGTAVKLVEPGVGAALELADGDRSIGQLARALGVVPEVLGELYRSAAAAGLVDIEWSRA